MIRCCDGQDPNLKRENEETGEWEPCDCGALFDDVRRLVIWPHTSF